MVTQFSQRLWETLYHLLRLEGQLQGEIELDEVYFGITIEAYLNTIDRLSSQSPDRESV